jgi:uncharacterized protein
MTKRMHTIRRGAVIRVAVLLGIAVAAALPSRPLPVEAQGAPVTATDTVFRRQPMSVRVPGAELHGWLLVPAGAGPHPTAISIPGARTSGAIGDLPEQLARRGIAVLHLDKRGVGQSTGRWDRQSFDDRAQDVHAAIALALSHPAVDPSRVGLLAHSQGGWVAQMVSAARSDLAWVVMLAGPGQPVRDQILTDERIHLERRGVPPAEVQRRLRSLGRQLSVLQRTRPVCAALRAHYLCRIIHHDPTRYLERMHAPVLALFAELDPMVPPDPNVALVRGALARGGNTDVTIHTFAQANHEFFRAVTGLRDESHLLDRQFVSGFVDTVATWVHRRGARPGPASRQGPIAEPRSAAAAEVRR